MQTFGAILIAVLKIILSDKVLRNLAADQVDKLVNSTETKVDNQIAAPILRYLRK